MQNPLQVKKRSNSSSKLLLLGIVGFGVASSLLVLFGADDTEVMLNSGGMPLSALGTPPTPAPIIISQPSQIVTVAPEPLKEDPPAKDLSPSKPAEARVAKSAPAIATEDSRQNNPRVERQAPVEGHVAPRREQKKPAPAQQLTEAPRPTTEPVVGATRPREDTPTPSRRVERERAEPAQPRVREITALRTSTPAEPPEKPSNTSDWSPIPVKQAPTRTPVPATKDVHHQGTAATMPPANSEVQAVSEILHVEARPLVPEPFTPHVVEAVGERVWLRIDPHRTIIVRPGQTVEGLGAFSGVSGKSAVFENSTLPLNK